MSYEANITVYDEKDSVVCTAVARGETERECSKIAGAMRDRLELVAECFGVDGANGWIEEPHPVKK